MSRAILIAAVLVGMLAQPAAAQIPPRYEIVQVTETPYYEPTPKINNHGQVVFMVWFDPSDHLTQEVFLYDDGELIQLTDNYVQDVFPQINDNGTIVWARGIGPIDPRTGRPMHEIVMWQDGQLTRLTDTAYHDTSPRLNNLGQVVWKRYVGEVCDSVMAMDIFFYDGVEIHQITNDGLSEEVTNQSAEINDWGDIVWTRYDFCVSPWESQIMKWSDGMTALLSEPGALAPRGPSINNVGQVAWTVALDDITWDKGIELWQDGVVTLFTDWGMGPHLNDHGDMCFYRWYEDDRNYQMWLWRRGTFYQLSDDPFWSAAGDINSAGEVVWQSGNFPWADIRLLRRTALGKLGSGGRVNPSEIRRHDP